MITHDISIKEVVLYDYMRRAEPLKQCILQQLRVQVDIPRSDYKKIIHWAVIGWFAQHAQLN